MLRNFKTIITNVLRKSIGKQKKSEQIICYSIVAKPERYRDTDNCISSVYTNEKGISTIINPRTKKVKKKGEKKSKKGLTKGE